MKRPLTYAKAQLEGGIPAADNFFGGRATIFTCQKCGTDVHTDAELDPCAFCNDCKDVVLDILAAEVVRLATRRSKR